MKKIIRNILVMLVLLSVLPINVSNSAAKKVYPKGELSASQTGSSTVDLKWSYITKTRPPAIYLSLKCANYSMEVCSYPSTFAKDSKGNYYLKINKSLKSYRVKGLTPGAIYEFSLFSDKTRVVKSKIDDIVKKLEKQLLAPRNLSASWDSVGTEKIVNLKWFRPFGYLGGYTLEVYNNSINKLVKSYQVPEGDESFVVKDLLISNNYKFTLYGKEDFNGIKAEFTLASVTPEKLTGFDLVGISESSMKVIWGKPLSNNLSLNLQITSESVGSLRNNDKVILSANSGEYIITGLSKGVNYTITAFLSNTYGESISLSKSLTVSAQPGLVTSLTATPSENNSIDLSWGKPESDGGLNITDYIIEYKLSSSLTWSTFNDGVGILTSTKITDLQPSSTYSIRVASVNSNGVSSYNSVIATTFSAPTAPLTLTSTIIDVNSVTLSWAPPLNNGGSPVLDYLIEYSLDNGSNWLNYSDAISSSTSATVNGLTQLAVYSFRVKASNKVGTSLPSNLTSITMSTVPNSPTNLLLNSKTDTSVDFSWSPPAITGGRDITDYIVEFSLGSTGIWNVFSEGVSSTPRALVTGLTPATSYLFRVKAVTILGSSGYTNPTLSVLTSGAITSAPRDLVATTGNGTAQLSWLVPSTVGLSPITDYIIEVSSNSGSSWSIVNDGISTSLNYTVTGLSNGQAYQFRVASVNAVGTSTYSNIASLNVLDIPTAPLNLALVVTAPKSIDLSWNTPTTNNGSNIVDYVVEYSSNNGSNYSIFVDGVNTNTSTTITGLSDNTAYLVRVRAKNGVGEGINSTVQSATTWNVPGAPTALSAITPASGEITVSWTAPASNGGTAVTDYEVEYSSDTGSTYTLFTDGVSTNTSANITGLNSNLNYLIRVRAVNAVGSSVNSSTIGVSSIPTNLTLSVTGVDQLTASWSAPISTNGSSVIDYQIDVDSGAGFATVNDGVNTSTNYVINGVTAGTYRSVRVRAVNALGASESTPVVTGTIFSVPGAPTSLVVSALSATQLNVSWTAPVNNGGSTITDYIVEYSSDAGTTYSIADDGVSNSTSAVVSSLTPGTLYSIRVKAKNSVGEGDYSLTQTGTTNNGSPGAPTSLALAVISSTQINATWSAPTSNGGSAITDYIIEISTNGGGTYTLYNDGVSATESANITSLSADTNYTVRVRAKNAIGESINSSTQSATTNP